MVTNRCSIMDAVSRTQCNQEAYASISAADVVPINLCRLHFVTDLVDVLLLSRFDNKEIVATAFGVGEQANVDAAMATDKAGAAAQTVAHLADAVETQDEMYNGDAIHEPVAGEDFPASSTAKPIFPTLIVKTPLPAADTENRSDKVYNVVK